jgi:cytochrome c-type biogenesis protein CcsB
LTVGVNPTLAQISNNLMYSAIAVYALALLAFTAEWALGWGTRAARQAGVVVTADGPGAVERPPHRQPDGGAAGSDRFGRIGVALTILAFGLHLVAVVARGLSAGRVPWGNMYEFSTASALAVTGVFLFLLMRVNVRWLGIFVVFAVLLTLGLAVTVLYTDAGPLVPALDSYWLVIHVIAAVVAGGAFTVGAGLSLLYLLRESAERRAAPGGSARLPAAAPLDRLAYRVHVFAFPIWTFAVIAGAIWAENAWGRYWGWDPKEVWAFITWVVYAAYLHARATAGWHGRRSAVIAVVGFATFLFNYFGVNMWITGLHSYAGL